MKIQLKRSSVLDGGAAKAPTADQMEFGELAVNYNTGDPSIFLKDSGGNIIKSDLNFDSSAFVKVIGGNMTGDLTLGTDKITLDATGGEATFAGNVDVGGVASSGYTQGSLVRSNGEIFSYVDNAGAVGSAKISVYNGESKQYLCSLNSDGSSRFTGEIKVGGTYTGQPNITLGANGSATFAGGDIALNTNGSIDAKRAISIDADGRTAEYCLQIFEGTTPNASILGNGSATFARRVQVGGDPLAGSDSGTRLGSGGGFTASAASTSANVWEGYLTGSASVSSSITAGGSATFGGDVKSTDGTNIASINNGGTLYVKQATANNSASTPALAVVAGTDSNVNIFTDGSATFKGDVSVDGYLRTFGELVVRADDSVTSPYFMVTSTNIPTDKNTYFDTVGSGAIVIRNETQSANIRLDTETGGASFAGVVYARATPTGAFAALSNTAGFTC